MRTLFGLLLVLGVAGFLLYRYVLPSSEKRSCERLAELCGRPTANVDRCVADVSALGKTSQEAVTRFDGCVADAKTCGEAAGCLVGAGVSSASGVFHEFMKGVGKALEKK